MQPTNAALQVLYGTLPLIGVVSLAMWNNNARLNEVSKRIDDLGKRMDDLRDSLGKRIDDLNTSLGKRIDVLADRVSALEKGTRLIQR